MKLAPPDFEPFARDVVRYVLRLRDLFDVEAVARALFPVIERRCTRYCMAWGATYQVTNPAWVALACIDNNGRVVATQRDLIASAGKEGYNRSFLRELLQHAKTNPAGPYAPIFHQRTARQHHFQFLASCPWLGRRSPTDSETHQISALSFLAVVGLTSKGSGCSACAHCDEQFSTVLRELQQTYSSARCPEFIRKVPDSPRRRYPKDDPLSNVREAIAQLRDELAVADVTLRRWSMLFARAGKGGLSQEPPSSWKLDPDVYPNDITFNTCFPWIPRVLVEATAACKTGDSISDPGDRLGRYLSFCLLPPAHFDGEDEAPLRSAGETPQESEYRQQQLRVGGFDPETATRRDLRQRADGGAYFSLFDWDRDMECFRAGANTMEPDYFRTDKHPCDDPWGNYLETTWSGAMMYGHRPSVYPRQVDRKGPVPSSTWCFDRFCLPAWQLILPLRKYDGQQVGFGICVVALPLRSHLYVDGHSVEAEYERPSAMDKTRVLLVVGKETMSMRFLSDVLDVENAELGRRLFDHSLAISLATMHAVRQIVAAHLGESLEEASTFLQATLFPGFEEVANGFRASHESPVFLGNVLRADEEQTNCLFDRLAISETVRAAVDGEQHSYAKHHLQAHIGVLYSGLEPSALRAYEADLRLPPGRVYRGSHPAVLRAIRRASRFSEVFKERRLGQAMSFAPPGGRTEVRHSVEALRSHDVLDLLSELDLLHGHRHLIDASVGSDLKSSDNGAIDLDRIEEVYWRILHVHLDFVAWDPATLVFRDLLPGLASLAIETLVLNGFKYSCDKHYEKLNECRVDVSLHSIRGGEDSEHKFLCVWDDCPDGTTNLHIQDAMRTASELRPQWFRRKPAEERNIGFRFLLNLIRAQNRISYGWSGDMRNQVRLWALPAAVLRDGRSGSAAPWERAFHGLWGELLEQWRAADGTGSRRESNSRAKDRLVVFAFHQVHIPGRTRIGPRHRTSFVPNVYIFDLDNATAFDLRDRLGGDLVGDPNSFSNSGGAAERADIVLMHVAQEHDELGPRDELARKIGRAMMRKQRRFVEPPRICAYSSNAGAAGAAAPCLDGLHFRGCSRDRLFGVLAQGASPESRRRLLAEFIDTGQALGDLMMDYEALLHGVGSLLSKRGSLTPEHLEALSRQSQVSRLARIAARVALPPLARIELDRIVDSVRRLQADGRSSPPDLFEEVGDRWTAIMRRVRAASLSLRESLNEVSTEVSGGTYHD